MVVLEKRYPGTPRCGENSSVGIGTCPECGDARSPVSWLDEARGTRPAIAEVLR
jgi:hypothetical protein